MQSVMTHRAPSAIGPYSQAVLMNNMLFISGQIGIDPVAGKLLEGFSAQAQQVFYNLKAILDASGMGWAHVTKVSVFLKDLTDFDSLNELYSRTFGAPYPARETIQVARLPKDALIEISLIAMR